jgi:hypothetical protein
MYSCVPALGQVYVEETTGVVGPGVPFGSCVKENMPVEPETVVARRVPADPYPVVPTE